MDPVDPVDRYRSYHTNAANRLIHVLCIPILAITLLAALGKAHLMVGLAMAYAFMYAWYLQSLPVGLLLYLGGLVAAAGACRRLGRRSLAAAHGSAWVAQLAGHACFEGNAPALVAGALDAVIWAPLAVYLEATGG